MNIILPKSKILAGLLFFIVILFGNTAFGQNIGDYRSATSGNWETPGSWQYYNGTAWVPATASYPGQNAGTYAVLIQAGHTISIGTTGITTNTMGTVTISGTLNLTGTSSSTINFSLNTNILIVTPNLIPKATINFVDKVNLILPANTNLQASTGGLSGSCSNNQDISIGGTVISYCNGGSTPTFETIMTQGGYNTAGTLSGYQYICSYAPNNTTTFTSTSSDGVWSSSNSGIASVNSLGVVTPGGTAGKATITYTKSSVTSTRDVYVANRPGGGVSVITGSTLQCQGSTANYTITSDSANYNHTWSYSGIGVTFVASADGRSATATFASNATSGNIKVGAVNACGSDSGDKQMYVAISDVSNGGITTVNGSPASTISGCANRYVANIGLSGYVGTPIRWEISTDNFGSIASTVVGNSNNINAAGLTQTTYYRAVVQNSPCTFAYSNVCTVTITSSTSLTGTIGSITGSPAVCPGTSGVSYSVAAVTGATEYIWSYSGTGVTISDRTLTPTISFAANATSGNLTVQATNGCGGPTSSPYAITVNTTILSQSTSTQTRCIGNAFNPITVSATGLGTLTYQWYSNISASTAGATNLGSANGAQTYSYTPQSTVAGTLYYYCIVSSSSCGTSVTSAFSGAFITNGNVAISSQSVATQTKCITGAFTPITVTASGVGLSYQWYSNISTTTVGATNLGSANGAQTYSYTPQSTVAGTLYYYCIVSSSSCGTPVTSAFSGAFITNGNVAISSQSTATQTQCNPAAFTPITVTASGVGLSYQWYSNISASTVGATNLGSANGAQTYSYTPQSTVAGTLYYYCIVSSSSCGTPVTSAFSGAFTVNPTPTLATATQTFVCDNNGANPTPATIKLTGLLPNSVSTVSYTIGGGAEAPITNVTANPAGEASFVTRNLLAADDNDKILQITGITTTSATPNCAKSFVGVVGIDIRLNVKSNSGVISLNGTPITTGSTSASELSVVQFSIAPIAGATSYSWYIHPDWDILSTDVTTNTISVRTGTRFQSANVEVTATNMFCSSSIWVDLSPVAPSIPTPNAIIPATCSTPGSLSFNNLPYGNWTLYVIKNGSIIHTISGSGNTYSTTTAGLDLTAGTYTITITDQYNGTASATVSIETKTWKDLGSGPGWYIGTTPSIAPDLNDIVFFEADYNGTDNVPDNSPDSINACSCTVKNGADVTIVTGKVLNIVNGLTVETGGTLTFENNASLVQLNDLGLNSGLITYKRTTPLLKDLDYEYWSSPVAAQKLSDLWQSDRYFRYTNGAWEAQVGGTTMDVGRGYIIRVRTNQPFEQKVKFIGNPNNGIKTIKAQGANRSNLIGNPYPSAIDAEMFMSDPENSIIGGALYFWTHFSARELVGNTYKYNAEDYAVYNMTGPSGTAPSIQKAIDNGTVAPTATIIPSGKIAAGQSFFVVSDASGDFTFNNSMRFDIDDSGILDNSQFLKQSNTKKRAKIERDRVWLNLTNGEGAFKQLLVGYITGASNDFDKLYDGVTRNGNAYVDFYSVNNSKNYTIQGRGLPFDKADEVPLGYKTTIEGTFQIGIDKVDGGMGNQTIYLEDKMTNTIHDLKSGSYSFTTAIGVFNDRFVLRYTNTSKLGTGDAVVKGKGVFVSVKNREIKINSFDQILSSVKVFDLKGSLLYEKNKVNKNEFIIDTLTSSDQFMIVMVQLEDGKWISEEIIFHD